MNPVSRYHPALVVLHWLIAVMVLGMLYVGLVVFDGIDDADPRKLDIILLHMVGGMTILALMAARLVVRWRTDKPLPAPSGNAFLDRLAPLTHYALYVVVLLTIACGFATALLAGLYRIVVQRSGEPLPDLDNYPTFVAHGYLAYVLLGLIGLHLAGALYHKFILKDDLLRRMGFGRR